MLPAGSSLTKAKYNRPAGGAYFPGRPVTSSSKLWKHSDIPSQVSYSRNNSRARSMSFSVSTRRTANICRFYSLAEIKSKQELFEAGLLFMDRRSFVTTAGASAAGLAVASSSLERLVEAMVGRRTAEYFVPGFGELLPTPTRNTGETFLALPKGFEYNVIGKVKSEMSDGRPTPSRHDGQW